MEDRATGSIAFSQISYMLLRPKNGKSLAFILILSSATDQMPTTQPIIEQAAKTFRFVD